MTRTIRGSFVLLMTASSALTGCLVMALAFTFLTVATRDAALERVQLVGAGVEPLATEVILTPGDVDLELALLRRLAKLRDHPAILQVGIVDVAGKRVPAHDAGEVPAVQGEGAVLTLSGDVAVGAYPLTVDGKKVGYLAITLAYPRWALWGKLAAMGVATLVVMIVAVVWALLASGPASRELSTVAETIDRLASGETYVPPTLREGYDEVGRVGAALQILAKRLDRAAELRAQRHHPREEEEDLTLTTALEPVAVASFLEEVMSRAAMPVQRRITLPQGCQVVLDKKLLESALGALLSNAVTHGGGKPLLAAFMGDGGVMTITVEDAGPGLSEWALRYLFRPVPDPARGFGTGLALARRAVVSMGGTLEHDRRFQQGARFQIRLPTRRG